jgi:hypothetical protein
MHSSVIWKLMSFTFAMITLPIGTYFFTVNLVFRGESFEAGLCRVVANFMQATQHTRVLWRL